MTQSLLLVIAPLFFMLFCTGCASHLHHPANLTLAEKAHEQFEALTKANEATFDGMFTNLATLGKINTEQYQTMGRRAAEVAARQSTKQSWSELRESFGRGSPLLELSNSVAAARSEVNEKLKEVRGQSKEAQEVVIRTSNELSGAKAAVTSWNRRVAVLDQIITSTPSIKEALEEVKSPDDFKDKVKAYTDALKQKLGEQKVIYFDADGISRTNNLSEEIEEMLDASADPNGSGKILAGLKNVFNPKAPGLVITAAALAKDLAEGESSRLSTQLDSLETRLRGLREATNAITAGAKAAKAALAKIPAADFPDGDNAEATFRTMAMANPPNRDKMSAAIEALSTYVMIHSEYPSVIEEALLNDAHLRHLESIKVSQISLRQHEAMAARGLESLLIYHSAGIKPEEIAELAFQVVQMGLLSWIGVGIN